MAFQDSWKGCEVQTVGLKPSAARMAQFPPCQCLAPGPTKLFHPMAVTPFCVLYLFGLELDTSILKLALYEENHSSLVSGNQLLTHEPLRRHLHSLDQRSPETMLGSAHQQLLVRHNDHSHSWSLLRIVSGWTWVEPSKYSINYSSLERIKTYCKTGWCPIDCHDCHVILCWHPSPTLKKVSPGSTWT